MTYLFEMEYERKKDMLSDNSQTTYFRLATVYVIVSVLIFGMAYLPEFYRPVMVVPILICAVSNPLMAVSVGLFGDIILALNAGGSFYAFVSYVLLTLMGGVVAEALIEKRFRVKLAFFCLFANLLVPDILYYLCYNETNYSGVIYELGNGVAAAFCALIIFPWLRINSKREVDNRMLDITSVDYSEVKALKDFSLEEYKHAVHVSNVAYLCAKANGLDKNVCLAAGFYYRMGQWLGEPCVQNGVDKARALCFPESVIRILSEYYGQETLPSTPESALVHMVDALVVRLDAEKSKGKRDQVDTELIIYQSLNEFSSSGIYDKSGMSMNLYIKMRGFLAKEELLH
jgi:hypothetical protein